jgi:hypothetical protein
MNRRELFGKVLGAGAALVTTAAALRASSDGTYNGPPGGSRGTNLVTVMSGPFSTAGNPLGLLNLTQMPQFVTYVRIQVNPGQLGKIAIASSIVFDHWDNMADAAFAELWPNYDGSMDNGRSDTWIMQDVNWQNTINLADIYVLPEIWGDTPLVTAYQLV